MNNLVEKQTEILNSLLQIMDSSVNGEYQSLQCTFDYYRAEDDNSVSIGEKFFYKKDDELKSEFLIYKNKAVPELVKELHTVMENHTGGNWKEFTLTLDENGKAHTKFIYE
ncbi:immunity protein YezG family protein [Acinetobacter populi]|uniref:DUF600 domain-containing protein n=1 Tax=Acinetobacter populi TaxID=1582270 RepID=A0A1Z9YUJ2_9GAMM|nr:immunity protein YezG family protein [Acinetobacter populi]OUY05878.1 hypothetical protein CAP51_14245 [Acinetobacter populi]